MDLGLQINSATWLLKFCIKSSAMDTWYLVSLATHLNWPELLENFPGSCSPQQFQVKSQIKYEYPWIKVAKFLKGHRWIPFKIKPRLFTSYFNRANDRAKFDYWGGRETLLSSIFMVWWHGYKNYRIFSKQSPWKYWPKKLFILTSWDTDKKLILIEGCWSTSSNQLPDYLYWKISK